MYLCLIIVLLILWSQYLCSVIQHISITLKLSTTKLSQIADIYWFQLINKQFYWQFLKIKTYRKLNVHLHRHKYAYHEN